MSETTTSRITTISRVYLIIALFIALIFCLVVLIRVQMDALTAIRAYVGGEGLWAKAQKDAVHNLKHYAVSHDEADYLAYRHQLQVPLGDRKARIELQKPHPNLDIVREGFLQGRNHPVDIEYAIPFFRRFQHTAYMSQVIGHWTTGDRLIAELNGVAEALHEEIASGRNNPEAIRTSVTKLDDINQQVTVEEDLFSSTLAAASRWANDVTRIFTYAIALLFVALGVGLSWPIITRIRAIETALVESEQRFRSIFEHVDDIIYTVEADGTFSSISPSCERMLGWQPAEWIGRPFLLVVHPDDLPLMQELFTKAQAGDSLSVVQVRILRKAGGYLESEIAVTPIHRGDSLVTLGVVRDITGRKQAEDKIRRLNEELETKVQERTEQLQEVQDELVRKEKLAMLGQVAGSVGHELRNPLGVMNNAVYFLQTVLAGSDESVKEYLGIILNEITRSEHIVDELLAAVRTRSPDLATHGVAELIGQILRQCTIPASVTVTLDIPETLPTFRVDALQMQQVLRNLISNGVEAMPEGGTLIIRAVENRQEGTVIIHMQDSGSGMTPEVLSKLFQPLFTTKARGIGLGLVVAKNLIEANGGRIEVQSEQGQGALFSIILPMNYEEGNQYV